MASMVYIKGAKQYAVWLKDNNGKRRPAYLGKDKAAATTEYHRLMLEHKTKTPSNKNIANMPFNWLADQFLADDYMQNEISRIAYRDYDHCLFTFSKMFPDIKCNDVDLDVIKKYKRYLLTKKDQGSIRNKQGVSLNRAKKHLMYLKRVFNWAMETGKLKPSDISFPKLKRETVPRKPPVFLSENEIKSLLSYKNNLPKYCNEKSKRNILRTLNIVRFILCSGRRVQEVVNLKKKHFNIDSDPMTYHLVGHKTEWSDPNPKNPILSDEAYDIVKPIIERINDDDYVFQNDAGGKIKIRALSQCFKKILCNLGVKNVSFKELRHSFASHMLMSGADLKDVQEMLCHASIKSTEVYAHVTKGYLKTAINNPKYNQLLKDDTITV